MIVVRSICFLKNLMNYKNYYFSFYGCIANNQQQAMTRSDIIVERGREYYYALDSRKYIFKIQIQKITYTNNSLSSDISRFIIVNFRRSFSDCND